MTTVSFSESQIYSGSRTVSSSFSESQIHSVLVSSSGGSAWLDPLGTCSDPLGIIIGTPNMASNWTPPSAAMTGAMTTDLETQHKNVLFRSLTRPYSKYYSCCCLRFLGQNSAATFAGRAKDSGCQTQPRQLLNRQDSGQVDACRSIRMHMCTRTVGLFKQKPKASPVGHATLWHPRKSATPPCARSRHSWLRSCRASP